MKRIELNHWAVKDNEANISLSHLHAKFNVLKNKDFVYYQLVVTDSDMKKITFNFYTLEDVFMFTEEVVNKSWTKEEVLIKYQQMFDEGLFSLPGGIKPPKKDKIDLTPEEVKQALVDYYGEDKNYRVSIKNNFYIDFEGNIKISYYLVEHVNHYGIEKEYEYMLTESDIKNALSAYVELNDYELIGFKYIGGVHRVGYFFDEDTPHYEGIEVTVVKKEKAIERTLSK